MKFSFDVLAKNSNARSMHFSKLLRLLKKESGCPLYDDSFEQWAMSEWGIKFLHGNTEWPNHLTGLEMEEATYTLLLLKYDLR